MEKSKKIITGFILFLFRHHCISETSQQQKTHSMVILVTDGYQNGFSFYMISLRKYLLFYYFSSKTYKNLLLYFCGIFKKHRYYR